MTNTEIRHISNRHDMRMCVYETQPEGELLGTVIMSHGLSSSSNRPLFLETTQTFLDAGYRVVRYDATHSLGASDGDPQYCTMTSLREDLEDVLYWCDMRSYFWRQKKVLFGHSLGSMAAGLCVGKGDDALILASSVTDGVKSFNYGWTHEDLQTWRKNGYVERNVGRDSYHRIRWSHYTDRCRYTLLGDRVAADIEMPVLLISGTEDDDRPGTDDLEDVLDRWGNTPERLDIEGAGHSIREPEHLERVNEAIRSFLTKL